MLHSGRIKRSLLGPDGNLPLSQARLGVWDGSRSGASASPQSVLLPSGGIRPRDRGAPPVPSRIAPPAPVGAPLGKLAQHEPPLSTRESTSFGPRRTGRPAGLQRISPDRDANLAWIIRLDLNGPHVRLRRSRQSQFPVLPLREDLPPPGSSCPALPPRRSPWHPAIRIKHQLKMSPSAPLSVRARARTREVKRSAPPVAAGVAGGGVAVERVEVVLPLRLRTSRSARRKGTVHRPSAPRTRALAVVGASDDRDDVAVAAERAERRSISVPAAASS